MIVVVREGASTGERTEIAELLAKITGANAATLPSVHWGAHAVYCLPEYRLAERDIKRLHGYPAIERVVSVATAYQLASSEFQREKTVISLRGLQIGGGNPVIIAGPCSVENEAQITAAAYAAREAGAHMLRGGAFKPRTSPYAFQGLGLLGVELLAHAGAAAGLPVVTEVMDPHMVPAVAELADVLQVGSRNMQNFPLLRAVGHSGRPVLLKRGFAATIEEWLLAAEYILAEGNQSVILCERGVRSFDSQTRNILDLTCVPLLATLTHLPVVVDPSHATGRRDLVVPMSVAAIAAGADGLLVEMHPHPDEALSDGDQSITPAMLCDLVNRTSMVHSALNGPPIDPEVPGDLDLGLSESALVASAG